MHFHVATPPPCGMQRDLSTRGSSANSNIPLGPDIPPRVLLPNILRQHALILSIVPLCDLLLGRHGALVGQAAAKQLLNVSFPTIVVLSPLQVQYGQAARDMLLKTYKLGSPLSPLAGRDKDVPDVLGVDEL